MSTHTRPAPARTPTEGVTERRRPTAFGWISLDNSDRLRSRRPRRTGEGPFAQAWQDMAHAFATAGTRPGK